MSTLKRHTPLAPANRGRRAKLHAANYGARGEAVRAMPCLVAKHHYEDQAGPSWHIRELIEGGRHPGELACSGAVEAAHLEGARGMGGCNADNRGLGPLCSWHHKQAGERRGSQRDAFARLYAIDCSAEVVRIAIELTARGLA